jgi:hypothetical protein
MMLAKRKASKREVRYPSLSEAAWLSLGDKQEGIYAVLYDAMLSEQSISVIVRYAKSLCKLYTYMI